MSHKAEKNRIFLLVEDENTYQPRVFETLIKELKDEVVGIGLVPFDPKNKGWKFYRYYFQLLGGRGFFYKVLQVLKQKLRGIAGVSRRRGPPSSVQELARRQSLPLLRTSNPNLPQFREQVKAFAPDLILSSQGFLLKKEFLDIPRLGCLNRHAGLLPKYRGIYPVFWAMLNDEKEIGVTVHLMNEKFDEGKIIVQKRILIEPGDTFFSLYGKVIDLTPELFLESIRRIERKEIPNIPNRAEQGSYFSYPKPEDIRAFRARGKRMI